MIEFNLFDNLIEFTNELLELLKHDWNNFKLFIKENKNYMKWLIIALITLQFTDIIDILNLGHSWNRYCKTNNIQSGGSNLVIGEYGESTNISKRNTPTPTDAAAKRAEGIAKSKAKKAAAAGTPVVAGVVPAAAGTPPAAAGTPPAAAGTPPVAGKKGYTAPNPTSKRSIKKASAAAKAAGTPPPAAGTPAAGTPPPAAGTPAAAGTPPAAAGTPPAAEAGTPAAAAPKENIFQKLKGRIKGAAGQDGLLGPVLGNLGGITSTFTTLITIVTVILTIIGVLSIPVLIFLVITYYTIKKISGKLALF